MISVWKLSSIGEESLSLPAASLDDATAQLPPGLYTTFRTYLGRRRVLGLTSHLDRLYAPDEDLRVEPDLDRVTLTRTLSRLLATVAPHEARVRLILDTTQQRGALYLMMEPLKLLPERVYQNGVQAVTADLARQSPRLKQTSFIAESSEERKAVGEEVFEVLLTRNGRILEGMTSNFYGIMDGAIFTAARGILLGVTRQFVLRLARKNNTPLHYRSVRLSELPGLDEAFITSSSRGIVPVVKIDGQLVGTGHPGSLTRHLWDVYQAEVLAQSESLV
jgi:branched-chain amino acid aminotransferase